MTGLERWCHNVKILKEEKANVVFITYLAYVFVGGLEHSRILFIFHSEQGRGSCPNMRLVNVFSKINLPTDKSTFAAVVVPTPSQFLC